MFASGAAAAAAAAADDDDDDDRGDGVDAPAASTFSSSLTASK